MSEKKLAVIAGIGDGLGEALAKKLMAENYLVIGLARSEAMQQRFVDEAAAGQFYWVLCDLYQTESIVKAMEQVVGIMHENQATISTYIHNASQLVMGDFLETSEQDFENVWRLTVYSAFVLSQQLLPYMLEKQSGQILLTGATASLKGNANFAAFASAKFALRGLAQSLAREFNHKGIHVVHVVLDGLIDCQWTRQMFGADAENAMNANDLAEAYFNLIQQPQSTWTHELDLRPFRESF